MAETQTEILRRIDEQSRRALRTGEETDVLEMIRLYDSALTDVRMMARDSLSELAGTEEGSKRARYLSWKVGREQQLAEQIRRRLEELRRDWTKALRDGLLRTATHQAVWEAYAIDQATPPSIAVNTRGLTATIPDAVIATPWEGAMFSDRIWVLTDDVAREMQQQVAQGALLGEGVDKIVKRLSDLEALDGNLPPKSAIERLVRTEVLKASDRAREMLYAENSDVVTAEIVIVTLDDRTCEICGPIDDELLGSDDVQERLDAYDAESRPPFHPNCRCTTAPKLKSWGDLLGLGEAPDDLERFDKEERVIRDPVTGKSRLAPTMSFDEWVRMKGLVGSMGLQAAPGQ